MRGRSSSVLVVAALASMAMSGGTLPQYDSDAPHSKSRVPGPPGNRGSKLARRLRARRRFALGRKAVDGA